MIPTKPYFAKTTSGKGESAPSLLWLLCMMLALAAPDRARAAEAPIDVDADSLQIDKVTQEMVAKGNVVVEQKGVFKLEADEARYQGENNLVTATGSIKLFRDGDKFLSSKIVLNVNNKRGTMEDVIIDMKGPGGRGGAKKMELVDGKRIELKDSWYTNCDCEDPPWRIGAQKVVIDQESNSVEARGMKLYFGKVPVVYFPWWRHPLRQERKSGFLRPEIRASGGNGMEFEVPYYWNIAPDKDMTVALRSISERGMMGKIEYRYLGLGYDGNISTNQIYDTKKNSYRGLTSINHDQRVWGWDMSLEGRYSQTRNFIQDFEQNLVDKNSRRLESHLILDKQWINNSSYSDVETGMLWYQDLERNNDDYTIQRLPYVSLSDNRPLADSGDGHRWRLQSDASIDSFYQLSGDATQRLDLAPTIRFQTPVHVGTLSAQVGVRETAYLIQGDPNQSGISHDGFEHREASMASIRLDGKLSKQVSGNRQHTIEPSVEYVINATSNQDHLPNYDAILRSFSTSNLFTSDQYSGIDRISNGQWVSYGVTSRLLSLESESGVMETATFKIGQRWAPDGDQEYQSGNAFSDIVGSLDLNFTGGWGANANGRIDPYGGDITRSDANITYSRANDDKLSIGYHYTKPNALTLAEDGSDRLEDLTLRSKFHLTPRWIYSQEADYSLEDSNIKSWKTQMEYEDNCWSLGFKIGRNLSADTSDHNGQYYGLIFSLKGLGGYGK